ncbi:MAG: WG repeat-containing protein [Aureispira sp.]|nr:WG repeat-containing protein [Aureispira sp.]
MKFTIVKLFLFLGILLGNDKMLIAQTPQLSKDSKGKYGYKVGDKWVIKAQYNKAHPFSDGLAAVKVGSFWGFIDSLGKVVLSPKYGDVHSFSYGKAAVMNNISFKRWVYINKKGQVLIDCQNYKELGDFYKGLVFVKDFWGYLLLDEEGSKLVEKILEPGIWKNDRCRLKVDNFFNDHHYQYVDSQGRKIGPPSLRYFDLDEAPAIIKKVPSSLLDDSLFAVINKDGKLVSDWHGAFKPIEKGLFWFGTPSSKKMSYKGILDAHTGKIVGVPNQYYNSVGYLTEDIIFLSGSNYSTYYYTSDKTVLDCDRDLVATPYGWLAKIGGKYGLVDDKLKTIIVPQYNEIYVHRSQKTRLVVKQYGYWGILDEHFNELLPTQYDQLAYSSEGWVFRKGKSWGVLDDNLKIKYSATADSIKFDLARDGVLITKLRKKWGAVNLKGETVLEHGKYARLEGKAGLLVACTYKWLYIYGKSGKLLYQEKNKYSYKYGLNITAKLDDLIWVGYVPEDSEAKYKELWIDLKSETSYYLSREDTRNARNHDSEHQYLQKVAPTIISLGYVKDDVLKYQYFDLGSGKAIGPEFDGLAEWETIVYWTRNSYKKEKTSVGEGITILPAMIKGLINFGRRATAGSTKHTEQKAHWRFWGGSFESDLAMISQNGRLGYMDKSGTIKITANYFEAQPFHEGLAAVLPDTATGLWGFIDKRGKEVITAKYTQVGYFGEGYCPVKRNDKIFFIDKKGNAAFGGQNFEVAKSFSEGLGAAKANGKWGYIDVTGDWVIEPQFGNALSFQDGKALVRKVGASTWETIDKKGNTVFSDE